MAQIPDQAQYLETLPKGVREFEEQATAARRDGRAPLPMQLEQMLRGEDASIISQLRENGVARWMDKSGNEQYVAAQVNTAGQVMHMAAAIPRDAGRSENYLRQVKDFTETQMSREDRVKLYHLVYENEGIVNNAINKMASLMATDGDFKIRRVKGVRGKGGDKRAEEFRTLMDWWKENVNARALDAVMSGARGVNSFIAQGTRLGLIEGSCIARTIWKKVKVPTLGGQAFNLPMNIQMFSSQYIKIPEELLGIAELMYWAPPATTIKMLTEPKDKNAAKIIKQLMDSKVLSELKANKQYLLDPALLIHIKNRGLSINGFGASMIQPALSDIAYKRALQALDIVTIENLINRLVIVKVGDSNKDSLYHAPELANERLLLLQRMFQKVGPSATILWAGPDIDVVEIGAHGKILEMDERYRIAESRIRSALGVPSALLTGDSPDGKSSGLAATAGIAAVMAETQGEFGNTLTQIMERIAVANNYEDVDGVWEFAGDFLADKELNANIAIKYYQGGLYSTRTALEEVGQNFEAEETRQAEDVARGYKDEPFGPPKSVLTTNPAGSAGGGGGDGRPTDTTEPDPRKNKEKKSPVESK